MNTNLENKVRSFSPREGKVIFFTALPDQDAMRRTMEEDPAAYGWEGDEDEGCLSNPSTEFQNWLAERLTEETNDNLCYYATIVPDDEYDLDEVFDKFLEKCYEEETGWLYELRDGVPETLGQNEEIIVLDYDEDYEDWEDLQLGVISQTQMLMPFSKNVFKTLLKQFRQDRDVHLPLDTQYPTNIVQDNGQIFNNPVIFSALRDEDDNLYIAYLNLENNLLVVENKE